MQDRTAIEQAPDNGRVGPILYLQGADDREVRLAVLVVTSPSAPVPQLRTKEGPVPGKTALVLGDYRVHRYQFRLPTRSHAWYELDGVRYGVDCAFEGDLRIAFVSCNGQEAGDGSRTRDERNAMWRRLVEAHASEPFQLLLHGGDQIYADELLDAHPMVRAWAREEDGEHHIDAELPADLTAALRQSFLARYLDVLSQLETAHLMATVPSLAMWDDHDICDGWGSMNAEKLDSPVGRALFAIAREFFLLFQLGGEPGQLPELCIDRSGANLGWHVRLPQLHLIAPDLRSERRPDRVLGEAGWGALERTLASLDSGRVLMISSVPALGPRLSWVEAVLHLFPGLHKYEDDLRDQWQSRTHRQEWRRFLEGLAQVHANAATPVTLLSGEIHLATRAIFEVPPQPLHQLVASGISHPAPTGGYALALDALARLGESPVPGRPIRMQALPGKRAIYTSQRNYLVLERQGDVWQAYWELERDGTTPKLLLQV